MRRGLLLLAMCGAPLAEAPGNCSPAAVKAGAGAVHTVADIHLAEMAWSHSVATMLGAAETYAEAVHRSEGVTGRDSSVQGGIGEASAALGS